MWRALQLIVVLALLYALGTGALRGLRNGKIRLRGGMIVTRHARPFLFWMSIGSCVVFSAVIIAAYALSFGHPMFSR
jgi:hypothetical protein